MCARWDDFALFLADMGRRPAGMTTAMHLCRGNFKGKYLSEGGYEDVAERMFNDLDIDVFLLEYDTDRAGDFAPLRRELERQGWRITAESRTGKAGTLFRWSMDRHAPQGAIWGISLSVPGAVQGTTEGDFLTATPPVLPAWEGFPLIETLTRRFGVPVWMRSSVETMTMGELHAGAGIGMRSMLFIKVGRRIGAGMVCDGQLYRGAQGAAGLIGSLPTASGGRSGTLDALAGSDMIQREGLSAAQDGRSPMLADILRRGGEITAIEVSQAAQMGDAVSTEILSASGHLIGQVVAVLANALNPDLIVLSGSIVQTNDILLAALREAVYGASHPFVTRDLRIIRSQMGSSAGLVGAARVASEALFAPGFLKEWVMQGSPLAHPAFVTLQDRLSADAAPPPPMTARAGKELST